MVKHGPCQGPQLWPILVLLGAVLTCPPLLPSFAVLQLRVCRPEHPRVPMRHSPSKVTEATQDKPPQVRQKVSSGWLQTWIHHQNKEPIANFSFLVVTQLLPPTPVPLPWPPPHVIPGCPCLQVFPSHHLLLLLPSSLALRLC